MTCPPCKKDWRCNQGRCPVEFDDSAPSFYMGEDTDRLDKEGAALLIWFVWGLLFVLAAFVGAPFLWKWITQ